MIQGYFVTGTDTGVGKTLVSCALLHAFAQKGKKVIGMKPIASGTNPVNGKLQNDDVLALRKASNLGAPEKWINPYLFEEPIAPHLAAQHTGQLIEIAVIQDAFNQLCQIADIVIVEGVGGFRVPINSNEDTADLALALRLPIILVVGMRLGCLNHALLSTEAIQNRDIEIAGWVANCIDSSMLVLDENLNSLEARIGETLLGVIPYQLTPNSSDVASHLDVSSFC